MHTKCLYVNAWDTISAYDSSCIDRSESPRNADLVAESGLAADDDEYYEEYSDVPVYLHGVLL